jgi:hypothetical protein
MNIIQKMYGYQQLNHTMNQSIKVVKNNREESIPLYLLYSNRSAAYIQDKNF